MIVIPGKDELSPKPISAGVYKAAVSEFRLDKTKTNKDMITATLTVTTPGPNANEKTVGRKLSERLVISPETMWRVDNFLKACTGQGLLSHFSEGESLTPDVFFMKISSVCQGREVIVVVGVEKITEGERTGKDTNVVKEIRQVQ